MMCVKCLGAKEAYKTLKINILGPIVSNESGLRNGPAAADKEYGNEEMLDFSPDGTSIKISPPIQSGSNGPRAKECHRFLVFGPF
jgi:hypothetical protein